MIKNNKFVAFLIAIASMNVFAEPASDKIRISTIEYPSLFQSQPQPGLGHGAAQDITTAAFKAAGLDADAASRVYAEHGRQVAEELSGIVRTMIWPRVRESGGTVEELRELVHRLKPLTTAALVAAYEQAIDDSAASHDSAPHDEKAAR